MDGNGRWATARGLDRSKGHVAGVDALREAVTTSVRLGLDVFSVYAFSTENWRRPQREVDLLMHLFATTLVKELPLFHQENVRLRFLGDLGALPERTRVVFQRGLDETADHTGMVFALAVNYGSRAEIARAARLVARDVAEGLLAVDDIDESSVAPASTPPTFPTPTCSSGPPESSGSPTTSCGSSPTPSSTSPTPSGPTSTGGTFFVP